jgi:hypothetical protein
VTGPTVGGAAGLRPPVTGVYDLPRADEWYPRECEFCTREAALVCPDPGCRAERRGEDREGDEL